MNTPKLFGTLALGLLLVAGTALAVGGEVGGLVGAQADAQASYGIDYSGALNAVDDLKETASAEAEARVDHAQVLVTETGAKTQAKGKMIATNSMKTSVDAKSGIVESVEGNLGAAAGWFGSLFVKPAITPPNAANTMNVAKDITTDIRPGYVGADAVGHADLVQDLGGSYGLEYNLPPPPQPKLGFLGSIKASFEWIADLS